MKTFKQFLAENDMAAGPAPQGEAPQQAADPNTLMARVKKLLTMAVEDFKELKHLPQQTGLIVNDLLDSLSNM